MNHNNILVFDSGVGGLSVYQAIYSRYPQLNFTYLFDNEGYPYGELNAEVLIDRVTRLIGNMVEKKLHEKPPINMVVIACNTASTIVLPALREILTIPVVGVVPAIKPAAAISKQAVGLIATPATINRPYTHDLIEQFSANVEVKLLGSTELVIMGEQKMRGEKIDLAHLAQILAPLINQIDVAILGCTHFPLLKTEIQQVLGEQVTLVDSGEAIANRVGSLLNLDNDVLESCVSDSDAEEINQFPFAIYSSATPEKEVALNKALQKFGFNPVVLFPLQGV